MMGAVRDWLTEVSVQACLARERARPVHTGLQIGPMSRLSRLGRIGEDELLAVRHLHLRQGLGVHGVLRGLDGPHVVGGAALQHRGGPIPFPHQAQAGQRPGQDRGGQRGLRPRQPGA
jgi:hypothetical protein